MAALFWRQFCALFVKNAIVFRKHWFANLLRCLLFPIGYGIFLGYIPNFFAPPDQYGLGTIVPIFRLEDQFDGSRPLVWVDNTDRNGFVSAQGIMNQVSANFNDKQRAALKEVSSSLELNQFCLSSFNGASPCYGTISFEDIPAASISDTRALNYTIRADNGVDFVNVVKHTSGVETLVLPIQWAVDQAIIELATGQKAPAVSQWPYTWTTGSDGFDNRRLLFLSIMGFFGGLAFFLAFTGIPYQLTGAVAQERATSLTSHMQAMGALDSARTLAWHLSTSLLYFPTWLILAGIWKSLLFTQTTVGLVILIHLITGFGLASTSLFISVPFSKSPQLAAVVATGLSIAVGVAPMMLYDIGTFIPGVLSFFFPSMFYLFSLKALSGFEIDGREPKLSEPDPNYGLALQPMIIGALIGIFVWPFLAIYCERIKYRISNPSNSGFFTTKTAVADTLQPGIALGLRNVRKVYNTSAFRRKSKDVVAIANLTLDVPSYGIFVLLGPNGAGKSTTLSVIGGLERACRGTVVYEGNASRPTHGMLGIVPQKNVLFPELSCLQTLRVWSAIKAPSGQYTNEDLEQLLRDCDLQSKMHAAAGTLSGGQKRKLQLAIGLVGGSKILLVDECTSGVDPLSRRALWKTLTKYRTERTILFTTHFLDEADFLADQIAVLAAPGKLIAADTPVRLKSTMGEGYSVAIKFNTNIHSEEVLRRIQAIIPGATLTTTDGHSAIYHLKTKTNADVARVLRVVEELRLEFGITSYDVLGTTIEDIFLDLVTQNEMEKSEEHLGDGTPPAPASFGNLNLSDGRRRTPWGQATTIFHKRALIVRRSWLAPLLALAVAISGAWWPVRFLEGGVMSCAHQPFFDFAPSFWPPRLSENTVYAAPSSLVPMLNASVPEVFRDWRNASVNPFKVVEDKDAFISAISSQYKNFSTSGGIYLDFSTSEAIVAYRVGTHNLRLFNILSNAIYEHALNATSSRSGSRRIITSFAKLPEMSTESLYTLQWLAIFGAAMAVFPAFFAIYIAKERHSSVQAMQLANGLANPLGLWLGHLMFDSLFTIFAATWITIVYGVVRDKFQGIGLLWLVMCLYGFVGTLLAYIVAILVKSPLGAFGVIVVSQFIIFLLYLTGYIVTLFSVTPREVPRTLNILHFTLALVAPINSLVRAAFVSVNQFSLLCDGENITSGTGLIGITRYGGPILYLIIWIFVLLFVLSQVDAGVRLPFARSFLYHTNAGDKKTLHADVIAEAEHANSPSTDDPLRVLGVSKSYDGDKVVDDVSFTIPHNSLFVLLGPNGAGKTTTFDIIHGQQLPDMGDVFVNNTSVVFNTKNARVFFGVCPQFTAIDAHLTVREHLIIYGRLKGLNRGEELRRNIQELMAATGLHQYAHRLATKLSGGNKRKLALAIALIGNPPVVLVDEYSTGIDAKMKRELWAMLKHVTNNKAVFLTTHSMEEASYLATKVGIMSKKMLAIGTPHELESRTASYEVHFSCHTRDDFVKVQSAMTRIPDARMVDDVATRFEVPVGSGEDERHGVTSVANLFELLAKEQGFPEFTVGKSTLETAFIRIINDDADSNGMSEDRPKLKKIWGLC